MALEQSALVCIDTAPPARILFQLHDIPFRHRARALAASTKSASFVGLMFLAGLTVCGQRTASGPIMVIRQSGTVIRNMHITSRTGDCLAIIDSQNVTVENSDIGPCGTAGGSVAGNGIKLSGNTDVFIYDNYIHPETLSSECCDHHDGIFGSGQNRNVFIQGNVIAYGESNIEFVTENSGIIMLGNFLLNPRGPQPRGQNVQCWGEDAMHLCRDVTVRYNYTLSSVNTVKYLYREGQEDSINFGLSSGVLIQDNYVTGGHSRSGCGIIADDRADNTQFRHNLLVNTGQCGIGIADGVNQLVTGNRIYNSSPVPGGGNTAIYVWKQYGSPCGPVIVSNNIADMLLPSGQHNAYWDGGGCSASASGNLFNQHADPELIPLDLVFKTPQIPPIPKECIAASPYTTNTPLHSGLPVCTASSPH